MAAITPSNPKNSTEKKAGRYNRLFLQLQEMLTRTTYPLSRMATIVAVLHNKQEYFFWTGFYLFHEGDLLVGPYQGPPACQVLERNKGVCWAGFNSQKTIIVPDVEKFPGHIACDSRSKSEIVVPVLDASGQVIGVLDVDSKNYNSFDTTDAEWLERIVSLIYA